MSLKGIVAAAALAVVAAIPTGAFLFEGKVPAPVDQIHQLPPWNGPKPGTAWDVLQIDGALQFLPWRIYMVDSMRAGYVPLWNPYSFGGAPFLANSQSAPMYPLHWLWPFDAESLLSFSAWLHVFIGGLGIYVLTRTLGASILGGLLAGTAFELCAFTVAWIQLPSVGMTAAWIPWCLWAVLRVCRAPSARNVAISSVFVGLMLLAGHLQIALYGMLATAMYGIWLCAWSRNGAGTKLLAGAAAVLLGSMLAAPQLAPSIRMALRGHRAASASADSWDAHEKQALQPAHLAALFVPGIFGMPQDPGPEKGMSGYWLGYAQPGRNYAELAFYVGPLTLPFALLAVPLLRRRPEQSFFAVLAVFAVAVALGTP
ncbi:MAG TPA: hypothetical protein VFG65_03775, partial [Fimbriimonadales bacterium]|nr:hypothetical protein [Fimbriimonadales bacterium]